MNCTLKFEPVGAFIFVSNLVESHFGHLETAIGFLHLFCRKFNCNRNPLVFLFGIKEVV